jgi:iron complex transport system substrate-binding protein
MTARGLKSPLLLVLLLALVASALAFFVSRAARSPEAANQSRSAEKIVSLAPAITETLFAIGAGERVRGVSDYCDEPPRVLSLPKLGTALTPNFERIARLKPDLILSEASVAGERGKLEALGPTHRLPWLSLRDIVGSVRELGRLTGRQAAATELASRIERRLDRAPPPGAPRVLVVLANETESTDPVWFIRKNSIHGAAIHAAGGRNAVDEIVSGLPRISLERVIALDPDSIVLLSGAKQGDPRRARLLERWRGLDTLRAVREGRIGVLDGSSVFSNGPGVLRFTDELERLLHGFRAR